MKPGMASILANQLTGLDACRQGFAERHELSSTPDSGVYPNPKRPTEVIGHRLAPSDPLSKPGGCGGSCGGGCAENCASSEKPKTGCAFKHEIDYSIPGAGCGCGNSIGTKGKAIALRRRSLPGHFSSVASLPIGIKPLGVGTHAGHINLIDTQYQVSLNQVPALPHLNAWQANHLMESAERVSQPDAATTTGEWLDLCMATINRKKCCCCVLPFWEMPKQPEITNTRDEVKVSFWIDFYYYYITSADGDCDVQWWEYSNRKAGGFDWSEPYKWQDFANDSKSDAAYKWKHADRECTPGVIKVLHLEDHLEIKKTDENRSTVHWVHIVARMKSGCEDCLWPEAKAYIYVWIGFPISRDDLTVKPVFTISYDPKKANLSDELRKDLESTGHKQAL